MEATRFDVPVNGGSLAVYRFGAATADAPVVVAVHGITGNGHYWVRVARELGGRASVVAPDLRGRGESRRLGGPFGAPHAADLLAILDHLGLERAVVAGHSLGAYVTARLGADHPERVSSTVLVDGGLEIPGAQGVDPQVFLKTFLGPAVARLRERFESREAYLRFWRGHPSFSEEQVDEADLAAFADHDLVGKAPELRSSVAEEAVAGDGAHLHTVAEAAHRLAVPAVLLCAERGLLNAPDPMVPLEVAEAWAAEAPGQREVLAVPDTNHYSIVLGKGASRVAEAIAARLSAAPAPA